MRLDLYGRVSTEKEQNVQQQIQHLRNWAIKNGHQIASETFDEQSGRVEVEQREKFMNLINNPKGDALLIVNLDRLTRNWNSVTFIEKHFRDNWDKYKLISTSDEINLKNANGRFMFRVKMAMNCYMPEDMLEKQVIGIERAKKEGKYLGRKKGAKGKKLSKEE
jgi:DNA invertase Pin-like site-specific DNA recombinase